MFCPRCKAEYRAGFTRCSDCDVDLVYELPAASEETTHDPAQIVWSGDAAGIDWANERQEVVWSTKSQPDCVRWCENFQLVDIPYRVNQRRNQILGHGLDEYYEILVPALFVERAKAQIEKKLGWYPDPNDPERSPVPDDDYLGFPDDPAAPFEAGPRDYKPWFPEDATSEVFSEPIGSASEENESKTGMIEMSLRENLIHSRSEDSNGSRKVFVLPEDEPRAREIVREVTTASPPV